MSNVNRNMQRIHRDNLAEGRGRPGGFTFIELLATVVLIGIIMPVAMAACLANTKLTELRVTGDWENGSQRGEFEDEWSDYQWKATVVGWTDTTMRQLDVTVSWLSQGKQRSVTLSTLIYPEDD